MLIEQGGGVCVESSDNCRISEAFGSLEDKNLAQRLYDLRICHNSVPTFKIVMPRGLERKQSTLFQVGATPSAMRSD